MSFFPARTWIWCAIAGWTLALIFGAAAVATFGAATLDASRGAASHVREMNP